MGKLEIKCEHCGSADIYKHGFYNGVQKYRCNACEKTFPKVNGNSSDLTKSLLSVEQIIDYRSQGMTLQAIGNLADLSRERVNQILRKYSKK